ncbi:hypothetical protein EYF80_062913 [Liparis tanakae]|uniref:Uncharacterized protein n=1 Tax=Liparis tanakae TaxID=230148 RepID=A0A4Z2EDI6_9TELE|nr:hypothetical protein EYF80_062913 [Liparis tanakae]
MTGSRSHTWGRPGDRKRRSVLAPRAPRGALGPRPLTCTVALPAASSPTLALGSTCRLSTLRRFRNAIARRSVTCFRRRVSMASRQRSTMMMSSFRPETHGGVTAEDRRRTGGGQAEDRRSPDRKRRAHLREDEATSCRAESRR